jgi:hypothetical protein
VDLSETTKGSKITKMKMDKQARRAGATVPPLLELK